MADAHRKRAADALLSECAGLPTAPSAETVDLIACLSADAPAGSDSAAVTARISATLRDIRRMIDMAPPAARTEPTIFPVRLAAAATAQDEGEVPSRPVLPVPVAIPSHLGPPPLRSPCPTSECVALADDRLTQVAPPLPKRVAGWRPWRRDESPSPRLSSVEVQAQPVPVVPAPLACTPLATEADAESVDGVADMACAADAEPAPRSSDPRPDRLPDDLAHRAAERLIGDAGLRDRLAEMIREELHGEMGARFSGNLLAVIRREVAQALDDRQLL